MHERPWIAWSRGLSFVNETAERDGVHKKERRLVSISVGNEQYRERILVYVKFRLHHRGVEYALLQPRWTVRELHEEVLRRSTL